ncbi:hypothetical protein ACFYU8_00605 [Brevibacillus sp. NPDC003359]|uniref:hypothetical protein n=1 Tax=unclassified Brevibacillus TaxID=2684853 RepID=UPI0036AF9CD4
MVKMVRLFTCLLAIFFIFFASVPVSEGAYLKPTYTFTLGKEAELKANVIRDSMIYGGSEETSFLFMPYSLIKVKQPLQILNTQASHLRTETEGFTSTPKLAILLSIRR